MLRDAWCPHCKCVRNIEVIPKRGQTCAFCGGQVPPDTGTNSGEGDTYQ